MSPVLEFAAMERVTKNQAVLLAFLLMTTFVVIDALLEPVVPDPVRTTLLVFSILVGIPAILERSPGDWPKRTWTHKAVFAGLVALSALAFRLLR